MDLCGLSKEDLMMLMACGFCDGADGDLCVYLSKIQDRRDHHYLFRGLLCGGDALLPVSGAESGGRRIPGLAGIFKLLGLRYLCVLCRHAVWTP